MTTSENMRGRYRHFKGGVYVVTAVAKHTETGEEFVVYRGSDEKDVWIRPLAMFLESVQVGDMMVPRFEKIPTDDLEWETYV